MTMPCVFFFFRQNYLTKTLNVYAIISKGKKWLREKQKALYLGQLKSYLSTDWTFLSAKRFQMFLDILLRPNQLRRAN